jgi:hypothetical protein
MVVVEHIPNDVKTPKSVDDHFTIVVSAGDT